MTCSDPGTSAVASAPKKVFVDAFEAKAIEIRTERTNVIFLMGFALRFE
jgi:hypothetical protein